jgi:hypothetical protein
MLQLFAPLLFPRIRLAFQSSLPLLLTALIFGLALRLQFRTLALQLATLFFSALLLDADAIFALTLFFSGTAARLVEFE